MVEQSASGVEKEVWWRGGGSVFIWREAIRWQCTHPTAVTNRVKAPMPVPQQERSGCFESSLPGPCSHAFLSPPTGAFTTASYISFFFCSKSLCLAFSTTSWTLPPRRHQGWVATASNLLAASPLVIAPGPCDVGQHTRPEDAPIQYQPRCTASASIRIYRHRCAKRVRPCHPELLRSDFAHDFRGRAQGINRRSEHSLLRA